MNIKDRLLSKRVIVNDCWLWQGSVDEEGYGRISVYSTTCYVHRVSYNFFVEEISNDILIRHNPILCNNRKCFNPAHLLSGNDKENAIDRVIAGNNKGSNKGHILPSKHSSFLDRAFWYLKTSIVNDNNCNIPNKKPTSNGYVNFEIYGKQYYLHRVICASTYGLDYYDKLWDASHKCFVTNCCNPEHLIAEDRSSNMIRSRLKKKTTKLNEIQVQEIKKLLLKNNPFKLKGEWDEYIGKQYNVTKHCIRNIRLGNAWSNI